MKEFAKEQMLIQLKEYIKDHGAILEEGRNIEYLSCWPGLICTPSSVSDEQGSSCSGVLPLTNGSWSAAAELSSDGKSVYVAAYGGKDFILNQQKLAYIQYVATHEEGTKIGIFVNLQKFKRQRIGAALRVQNLRRIPPRNIGI
nr:hypothetical protein Iba_chr03aCG3850 [Ipomoea batatas]GMD78550.1 hypothetical protein Iba_chr13cCG14060 [Ipomoea batatas]